MLIGNYFFWHEHANARDETLRRYSSKIVGFGLRRGFLDFSQVLTVTNNRQFKCEIKAPKHWCRRTQKSSTSQRQRRSLELYEHSNLGRTPRLGYPD